MLPLAGGGRFESIADKIRLPDDVTVGFISEHLLGVPLTVVKKFHSHLEPLRLITDWHQQISFSYSKFGEEENVLSIEGNKFTSQEDPTRYIIQKYLFSHLV